MTIRNDLAVLARRGLVERVHGGAMVKDTLAAEPSYYEKATRNLEEKKRIGKKAAELIEENMAVFIGKRYNHHGNRARSERAPSFSAQSVY